MRLLIFGCLCLLAAPGAAETLYKCVDGNGQITYQDNECAATVTQQEEFEFNPMLNVMPAQALPPAAVAPPPRAAAEQPPPVPGQARFGPSPPDLHSNVSDYAAWTYAREQLQRELRNCRIMETCPTPLDRMLIMQVYGFVSDVQVLTCQRDPAQCVAW